MAKNGLPEISLTCREGHAFKTRARGGQPTKCPECRVSVWVPKDRPTVEGEFPRGDPLEGRWEAFSEPQEKGMDPSPHPCPECGSERLWEPGRTMLYCPECETQTLPPSIEAGYAQIALQNQRESAVERRAKKAEEMLKRMGFAAEKAEDIHTLRSFLEFVDPNRLPEDSPLEKVAVQFTSHLNHLIKEINRAETPEDLETAEEISNALLRKIKEHETVFRNAHEEADREDEEDYEEDDEGEYVEAEVIHDPNPRTPAVVPQRNYPGTYLPVRMDVPPSGPPQYRTPSVETFTQYAVKKAMERQALKKCQFDHFSLFTGGKVAYRRLYGADYPGGPYRPGRPEVYCCEQHWDSAVKWMESQGFPNSTFDELS